MHLGGSDDGRPCQALLVMVGFGDASHHTRHANAVGAHPHRHGLAVLVKHLQAERVGILQTELEHLTDFHTAFEAQRAGTVRAHVAVANLHGLHHAVGLKVTAIHEIVVVNTGFISAGEPCGAAGDMRVDKVTQRFAGFVGVFGLFTAASLRAKRHRADIALDEFRMLLQILVGGLFDFSRSELRFKTLHVDGTIARHADNHQFAPRLVMIVILRMHHGDYHILQNIGSLPRAAVGTRMVGVGEFNHLIDGFSIRRRTLFSGWSVAEVDGFRFRSGQRLNIPSLAARRLGEGVFADFHRSKELFGFETAHRAGHGVHRHILQIETVENTLIGATLVHIRLDKTFLVEREGVGVLHDEFTATDQACTRTEFVTILGLNLVEGNRQILVGGVQVLDQQGEHFLMGRCQQVVGLMTILQTEDVVAILFPTMGGLIRLTRQQTGEVNFLGVDRSHFLTDDVFDLVQNIQTQRQPGPNTRSGLAQVAGALQKLIRYDICIGGILTQSAQEHGGHTKCFSHMPKTTQARGRKPNPDTRSPMYGDARTEHNSHIRRIPKIIVNAEQGNRRTRTAHPARTRHRRRLQSSAGTRRCHREPMYRTPVPRRDATRRPGAPHRAKPKTCVRSHRPNTGPAGLPHETAPHTPCRARRCAANPSPHGRASYLAICGW